MGFLSPNVGKYTKLLMYEGILYGIMPLFPPLKTERGQLLE